VRPAAIQLTCFENAPIVRFSFDFKIGSDVNSILGYRFDDKPGHDNVPSRIVLGYNVIIIEDKNEVARFVSELATSKILAVPHQVDQRRTHHRRISGRRRARRHGRSVATLSARG
jgi:hypothetical protein